METLNMIPVSVDQFIELVNEDLEDENYDPMIGIGKSGVGKTMSIYELTQKLGIGFCELRLVTLTEIDLLGIPDTVENPDGTKSTTYASNELLPREARDGERGILVLDEITSATSTIRAAAYQLLDSKRALGNYKLPPKWKVIALGNGPDDGGVFQGMEAAFLTRGMCYRIEPELDSWKKWALSHDVNSSVIAYLSFDPSKLHVFDPDELASVFPCPRSWTALSTRLNKREERKGGMLEQGKVELYAAGAIGAHEAPSFAAFYNYNSKTISVDDILNGKANPAEVASIEAEAVYLVIESTIKALKKKFDMQGSTHNNMVQPVANLCNWLVGVGEQVRLDYAIMGVRDIVEAVPQFTEIVMSDDFDTVCPNLVNFAAANNIALRMN